MHPFTGIIAFVITLLLASTVLSLSECTHSPIDKSPPTPQEMAEARAAVRRGTEAIAAPQMQNLRGQPPDAPAPQQVADKSNDGSGECGGVWNIGCTFLQLNRALGGSSSSPQNEPTAATATSTAPATSTSDCFSRLAGTWRHPVAGTWTFQGGNRATSLINSINYGAAAQQITELSVISCSNGTLTYKIVRAALINTVDPSMAYDKTPANAPSAPNWSKTHSQAYAINGNGLKFGNYTYTK